jgi:hypothetical protein
MPGEVRILFFHVIAYEVIANGFAYMLILM